MELDLHQSLSGFLCTAVLIGWDPETPPLPPHLGSYLRALLASQDGRHLFVTPWLERTPSSWPLRCIGSNSPLSLARQAFTRYTGRRKSKREVLYIQCYSCSASILEQVKVNMSAGIIILNSFMYVIKHCFTCCHGSIVMMLRLNPGMLRLWHWQLGALTTWLDLLHSICISFLFWFYIERC